MTDDHIIAAMDLFGIAPADLMRAQTTPETLVAFQQQVKDAYRSLVKSHHPDKGGDTQTFNALTAVHSDVQAMTVRRSTQRRRFKWAMQIQLETA